MNLMLRRVVLLVLIVVTFGGASSALHTASAEGVCALKSLSAVDCKLIADASGNLASMKTFVMDYTASLTATGLPNGNVNFSSQGSGPVDITHATGADLGELLGSTIFTSKLNSSLTIGNRAGSGPLEVRLVGGWVVGNGNQVTHREWEEFSVGQIVASTFGPSARTINAGNLSFDALNALQKFGIDDIPGAYQARSQPGRAVDGQATTQISVDLNIFTYLTYLLMPDHRDQLRAIVKTNL